MADSVAAMLDALRPMSPRRHAPAPPARVAQSGPRPGRFCAQKDVSLPSFSPCRRRLANLHVHSALSHDSQDTLEEIVAAAEAADTRILGGEKRGHGLSRNRRGAQ